MLDAAMAFSVPNSSLNLYRRDATLAPFSLGLAASVAVMEDESEKCAKVSVAERDEPGEAEREVTGLDFTMELVEEVWNSFARAVSEP